MPYYIIAKPKGEATNLDTQVAEHLLKLYCPSQSVTNTSLATSKLYL